MRRPSRQGLSEVCTLHTPGPITDSEKERKIFRFHPPGLRSYSARVLYTLLLILVACSGFGQTAPTTLLREYFEEIRQGKHRSVPAPRYRDTSEATLILLGRYLGDTVPAIREKASEVIFLLSSRTSSERLRHRAVAMLVSACGDPEVENAGLALNLLTRFHRNDFTPSAKDSLAVLARSEREPRDQFIRLAGFLQLRDLTPLIRKWTRAGTPTPVRWASFLALARLGDAEAAADILKRVARLPVNDDVVYRVFPDLLYTRHPQLVAYTVNALLSDEKNCLSADAEREIAIPCGYRIMELLAPIIDGYPLEVESTGDIKTDNYRAALTTVQQWFRNHKEYRIRNDRY